MFNVVYEHVGLGLCLAALGGWWLLGGRGGGSRKEHIDMPGDGECKHFISCVNILCICLQSVHVKITVANQILVRGQIFLLLIRWYTFLRAAVALFADDCWRIFCGQRGDNGGTSSLSSSSSSSVNDNWHTMGLKAGKIPVFLFCAFLELLSFVCNFLIDSLETLSLAKESRRRGRRRRPRLESQTETPVCSSRGKGRENVSAPTLLGLSPGIRRRRRNLATVNFCRLLEPQRSISRTTTSEGM